MNRALALLGRSIVDLAAAVARATAAIGALMKTVRQARTVAQVILGYRELLDCMERDRRARRPVKGPERTRPLLNARTAARRRADRTRIERWLSSRGRFGHK